MDFSSSEFIEMKSQLQGSFLFFCQYFYKLLTMNDFIISSPVSRESHFITCSKILSKCARGETNHVIINVPPGHGKSTLLTMWVAWTMTMYPDSQYMYLSYSKKIATKQTSIIKQIMSLYEYKSIFNVHIAPDSKAKEFFKTTQNGTVAAFGAAGSITGFDAGLPGKDRFSGALIIDDAHKPDEAHSDTIRDGVIKNYQETSSQRVRGVNVPIIFLGQRLHEADLAQHLIDGGDGRIWDKVVLKSIDDAGNALYPETFPLEFLERERDFNPYTFASQHQQHPVPSGGALFKPKYFALLDEEPKYLTTFITADTAETDKTYNDATVFSFFGLYKLKLANKSVEQYALHWIDCEELFVEPKDLKDAFMMFWTKCMRHKSPPLLAAIEKKSTGTTLISTLEDIRGMKIRDINRDKRSKTQRFLDIQPYVYAKLVSMTENADHVEHCINHMSKITANNSHRRDDIADTLADACRIAFIDKTIYHEDTNDHNQQAVSNIINADLQHKLNITRTTGW